MKETKSLYHYLPCGIAAALHCLEMAAFFQSPTWGDSEWASDMADKELNRAEAYFLQEGCFDLHEQVRFSELNRF